MGLNRLWISASSLLAVVAMLVYVGDSCVDCDQTISASGTTSTTEPASEPILDDSEVSDALRVGVDLQGFASMGADGAPSTTTTEAETTTTEGDTSTTSEGDTTTSTEDSTTSSTEASSSTTATTAEQTTTASETTKVAAAAETSTTEAPTTTSTTAAPTTQAPAPPAVNSNVPVNGSKIYVNPNGGNDGNDGTSESKALKSLQNALRRVQAGQTVYLMSGEYREVASAGQLHYWIKNSGNSGNWIRIANAPGHSPVIIASSGTGLLVEANYVEVSGIQVKGQGYDTGSNPWGVGISVVKSHHVRLLNNRVSGMPTSGIGVNDCSNVHVINNTVYENSFWNNNNGSGISFFEQENRGQGPDYGQYHDVIIGNRVFRNENKVKSVHQNPPIITDGNGIIIDSNRPTRLNPNKSAYSGRTLVANNLVYDNGGRGVMVYGSNHVDVMFNTAYHNGRTPMNQIIGGTVELGGYRVDDVRFYHNIGYARPGRPAMSLGENTNTETKGNYLVTDQSNSYAGGSDVVSTGNPGLRNPTTNGGSADFRPVSGGALIGKASANGNVSRDMVGTSRSGSVEPGAFEAEAGSGR